MDWSLRLLTLGFGNVAFISLRLISRRKVGGVPRSKAVGSYHHDRLKGKSYVDIGSNPILEKSPEALHSIERSITNRYPACQWRDLVREKMDLKDLLRQRNEEEG